MRGTYTLGEHAEKIGRTHLPSDLEIEASGMMALSGGWLDEIVNGQRNGVLVSIAAITLLMILGLRSLSVGLVSLIPNLLPLVATTALCGWVWDDIDSDTLVVLMMAIGIGVDDTIHFLMRYRIESARCDSTEEAISRTFQFAGRAIVMTTLILSIGFSPMMLSEYYSIAIVGSLLPFALLIAMMADLLLVPALAQVGALRYRNKT
jgi:predicted RND superfamily exporter protein